MLVSKKENAPRCNIHITCMDNGGKVKQVEQFCYFRGLIVTSDGRIDAEVKKRIALAKESFIYYKEKCANKSKPKK